MRHLKLAILPALFDSAATLLPTSEAVAHERGYRDYVPGHAVVHIGYRHVRLPRWLRHNYDFVHWYRINHYSIRPHASWKRVYRRYQRDYYYHRHYKRDYWPSKRKRMKKHKRRWRDRHGDWD